MKSLLLSFITLAALTLCACSSGNAKPVEAKASQPNSQTAATETTDNTPPSDYTYTDPSPKLTEEVGVDPAAVMQVVKDWDQCHRAQTISGMDTLYAHVCLYYGTDQTREFIVRNKQTFFAKHPRYTQYIDNVEVDFRESSADITFTKHVRVSPDSQWQTYEAYLHLVGGVDDWYISWESDKTTDENLGRREKQKPIADIKVDNTTPVTQIFNDQNVGKRLCVDYWGLVGFDDDATEGPLAKAISGCNTIGARNEICGVLRRNFNGNKNTLFVGGTCSGGSYTTRVLWIYNRQTRSLQVYPEF